MNEYSPQSVSIRTAIIGILVALFGVVIILTLCVYLLPSGDFSKRVRGILPYPAIAVNGINGISFREADSNILAIRQFYENQAEGFSQAGLRIDFSTPDGEKRLAIKEKEMLNKMVEDEVIQQLALQRGISITMDIIQKAVNEKLKTYGNNKSDVVTQLERLYGWGIDDFERKVVMPDMYREALAKTYEKTQDNSEAHNAILLARKDLDNGESFEKTAARYSNGSTAMEGGDLGWVPLATLTPEIADTVKQPSLNMGVASAIIESPLGFHILMVDDRKQDHGQEMVKLKQIFTRKVSFSDWLSDQMKAMHIIVLYRDYTWDKATARVDFSDEDMKKFEKDALQKSQGDASLLF